MVSLITFIVTCPIKLITVIVSFRLKTLTLAAAQMSKRGRPRSPLIGLFHQPAHQPSVLLIAVSPEDG